MVFVNSKSLSSLKIDDTPVDDPSLKVLVANNSDTLKLLKMSSCPHVSPAGMVCTEKTPSRLLLNSKVFTTRPCLLSRLSRAMGKPVLSCPLSPWCNSLCANW